jgi:hypothetical protein
MVFLRGEVSIRIVGYMVQLLEKYSSYGCLLGTLREIFIESGFDY